MNPPDGPDPELAALAAAGEGVEGLVGASDVLQDAYVDVSRRVRDYLADPQMPFFLWLRFITAQRLVDLQRQHLGAKMRDVRRQVDGGIPGASTPALVDQLMGHATTPTQRIAREERRLQVAAALHRMDAADREVLVLRHFEELSNIEAARELGLKPAAASKRYVRALGRLQEILEDGASEPDAPSA